MRVILGISVALSAVSVLLIPAAPAYDPTMWLLWGRELAGGSLDTTGGPAFKPGPVAVCTLLAPLGDLAPDAWLVVARAGLLSSVGFAGLLAQRLSGTRTAAAVAGLGVALAGPLAAQAGMGSAEGLVVAFLLAAALAHREGRVGLALALGAGGALIRIEALPLLAAYAAVVAWRAAPALRPAIVGGGLLLPFLWLAPDWLAGGELLRSADRARIPNPGQPALAAVPALDSLAGAVAAALAPVAVGVAFLRRARDRTATALAAAGLTWVVLVAGMAELGFSGEARYSLPGIALVTVAGAVGLSRASAARRWAGPVIALLVVAAMAPRLADAPARAEQLVASARFAEDLRGAITAAGGRAVVLRCGAPVVGRYRGPMAAYELGVAKSDVVFRTRAGGVVLRSRLPFEPTAAPGVPPGYAEVARSGSWTVLAGRSGAQRRFCSRARSRATAATAWPIAR